MALKNRLHRFGEQDWATPAMSEGYSVQRRMQIADARLQRIEQAAGFAAGYVDLGKPAPIVHVDQSSAPHYRVGAGHPSPEILEIHGVERLATSQADRFQLLLA